MMRVDSAPARQLASTPSSIPAGTGSGEAELLDRIYQAPLAPRGYHALVELLRRSTGALGAGLWAWAEGSREPLVVEGLDAATVERLEARAVAAVDSTVWTRSDTLTCAVSTGSAALAWSAPDRALIRRLAPHLHRSLRVHQRITRLEAERRGLAGVLDRLAAPVVVLDARGRVIGQNESARRLLDREDGLSVRDGRLIAARPHGTRRVAQAVERAQRCGGDRALGAIALSRPSGAADLSVAIVPMGQGGEGTVAVFVNDPELAPLPDPATLRDLYRLTPAEARLSVALARGLSLQQAAVALGVSQHTARNHLKAVFAKTGVSRQGALVRTLLAAVAPVVSGPVPALTSGRGQPGR